MYRHLSRRDFIQASTAITLGLNLPVLHAQNQAQAQIHTTPLNSFNATSTAEEVTAGLDLSGKTAVVTGCNSGLGFETMRVLAMRGAHVIGAARTIEKANQACQLVAGKTTAVAIELSDFNSVVNCAKQINNMNTPIDMLICNAGIVYGQLKQIRGLEIHFVVNHLGHFLLTNHLINKVIAAPQGRVVVVGSNNHKQAPAGGIQFDSLSGESWGGKYYHHSKLANGLFSLELAKRLKDTSATSNCAHPGGVRDTNILRNVAASSSKYPKTVPQGAATQCYVAAHPSLASTTALYFADCNPAAQSKHQTDEAMATRLWQVSEQLLSGYLI